MNISKASLILIIASALCGCASNSININEPTAVSTATQVSRDEFRKTVHVKGPRFSTSPGTTGIGIVEEIALEMMLDEKSGVAAYSIFVIDYVSRRQTTYNTAYDSDGNQLQLTHLKTDVYCRNGCTFDEYVSISVSRKYLQEHSEQGIRIKISGRGGEEIFSIPAGYIQGFLRRTASLTGERLSA